MKKVVKKNYKIIIGVIVGLIVSTMGTYAAEQVLTSDEVLYNNGTSHGTSDNVQGAIDDLYQKINTYKVYIPNDNPNRNIVKAYKYDEDSNSNTYCVTGDEGSCFITSCYDNKAEDSCPSGTIIDYKVNDNNENNIIRFHVIHDDGEKMTLQSQQHTVNGVHWYATGNEYGDYSDSTHPICRNCDNTKGPLTALAALEDATKDWNNVNELNYSIGDKDSTLGYSGCNYSGICDSNTYVLKKEKVNVRMITIQEATKLGCEVNKKSCPIWMYNDFKDSGDKYWTMSALMEDNEHVYLIQEINRPCWIIEYQGARAVVEINK